MLLFILMAIVIAKIKKYKILCIFRYFDLYPLFLVELLYWFFQVNVYFENYTYVRFASQIQIAYILVLLVPILRRRLYRQALFGSGMVAVGSILNRIVISANQGKMPVYPTLSYLTGYYKSGVLGQGVDSLHILMSGSTKLNVLGDFIDTGFSIMSVGDLLIHTFIAIVVFYTIKRLNSDRDNLQN
jgi:hypothetical protein